MNPRLIRSLQRGGIAAKLIEPGWGVWRGGDRRHRMIGTFTGAEIDLLRLYECLQSKSSHSCSAMRWRVPNPQSKECLEGLMMSYADPAKTRSCLDQVILTHRAEVERWKLADSARAFRHDALAPNEQFSNADEACGRLGLVIAVLSERESRFAYDLLVRRATKLALAKRYEQRPAAIQTKAINVLRRIASVYA
ncbi:MAG: hypothetical protein AAF996_02670 [Pseudomonadota bacterium]